MDVVALVGDGPPVVGIELVRDSGKRLPDVPGGRQFSQQHVFLVDHGAHVHIADELDSATIRTSLGRYGRVNLSVRAPEPAEEHSCDPSSGVGVARGTLRLRPGGRYFGTIVRRRLPALILGDATCATRAAVDRAAAARLVLGAHTKGLSLSHRNIAVSAATDELSVATIRAGQRVFVTDTIEAHAPPPSTFVAAPDLSTATVRAFGPFLSGAGTYTATSPIQRDRTTGTLSGNLVARFDTPSPVAISNHPIPAVLSGSSITGR